VFVLTQLSDRKWVKASGNRPHFLRDFSHVFKDRKNLKKWLVIASISQLPIGMVFPYTQAFAHSIKGADEFVLGAIISGSALASIVFAIPFGRLADRIGRKQVLFLTIPLFWASNLMLVFASSSIVLVIAGILQGFYFIGAPITAAIERELVPSDLMGRWIGINRFCKMITSATLALTAGIIWDEIGPQYIFFAYVGIDLLIRIPLLISIPETLHAHFKSRTDG
jgi:MFS family permease